MVILLVLLITPADDCSIRIQAARKIAARAHEGKRATRWNHVALPPAIERSVCLHAAGRFDGLVAVKSCDAIAIEVFLITQSDAHRVESGEGAWCTIHRRSPAEDGTVRPYGAGRATSHADRLPGGAAVAIVKHTLFAVGSAGRTVCRRRGAVASASKNKREQSECHCEPGHNHRQTSIGFHCPSPP